MTNANIMSSNDLNAGGAEARFLLAHVEAFDEWAIDMPVAVVIPLTNDRIKTIFNLMKVAQSVDADKVCKFDNNGILWLKEGAITEGFEFLLEQDSYIVVNSIVAGWVAGDKNIGEYDTVMLEVWGNSGSLVWRGYVGDIIIETDAIDIEWLREQITD